MNERTREKEKAERRALALKKLAKVFGTNGGDGGTNSHTAEKKILNEILRSTTEPSVVGLVRDRLAVLSARDESDESDEDFDITVGVTGAGHERIEAVARIQARAAAEAVELWVDRFDLWSAGLAGWE